MILDHVAHGTRRVVERATPLNTEVFGHGYLQALHVIAVPKRLRQRIREAKEQDAVDGALPQVMIDPEDALLVEHAEQDAVELPRRCKVGPERLFYDDTGLVGASGCSQLLYHPTEQHGRDGQVVRGPPRGVELLAQRREGRRVVVV